MKKLLISAILASSLLCGCRSLDPAIIWLDDIFSGIEKDKTEVTAPTTTTTIPPAASSGIDELPWESITWLGQANCSKALPTKLLRSAKMRGSQVILDYDTNSDWNVEWHGGWDRACYGRFCVFYIKDGRIIGGHSDHLILNKKDRDLGNCFNGYLFNPAPPEDAELYVALVSNDRNNRTNIVRLQK